jgi:hypothetical protein
MKQFYDYRMADGCSVVEQAHEIQTLVKELGEFWLCCQRSLWQAALLLSYY